MGVTHINSFNSKQNKTELNRIIVSLHLTDEETTA